MDKRATKVLTSLQRLCSRQECCSKDVYAKALAKLDGDSDAASEILESLMKDGYVDDFRYCVAFCSEKSSLTGWGPVKISFALRGKGMDGDMISSALAEMDQESAENRLHKLLLAKSKTLEGDPQARLKLVRFALSRGYDYPQVAEAVEKIHNNSQYEDV